MIPSFQQIRIQILKELRYGNIMQVKDLQTPLANHFKLTPEEVNAIYNSGNGNVFRDRISWALSYLFMSKLIEKPKRGEYVISQMGKEMIASCNEEQINAFINKAVNKPKATTENVTTPMDATNPVEATELTPQEALNNSFENIKQSIKTDLLATILSKKQQAFEILVVDLLQAMGYGGEIKNAGVVTQLSNDGGIDGIIKEDVLGFNHISIQAKRYAEDNHVSRKEVQTFVGAVAGTPSKKGVFITTSSYTKGAIEYVESLNGSPIIILINGEQLTEYIYECGLGLQTERVLKVMKLDRDYWDTMLDE